MSDMKKSMSTTSDVSIVADEMVDSLMYTKFGLERAYLSKSDVYDLH